MYFCERSELTKEAIEILTSRKLILADKTAIQKLSDKMQSYHFFPEKWSKHLGAATKVIIDLSHDYQLHPGYQITEATNISSRPMMRMSAQWGVTHAFKLLKKVK